MTSLPGHVLRLICLIIFAKEKDNKRILLYQQHRFSKLVKVALSILEAKKCTSYSYDM